MDTINEDYVSLDTAKLLKDKGFRVATNRYYNAQFGEARTVSDAFMADWNDDEYMSSIMMPGAVAIPTLQTAMKWLRGVHDIHISIRPYYIEPRITERIVRYLPEIYTLPEKGYELVCEAGLNVCDSYEQALESAIVYSLENLI